MTGKTNEAKLPECIQSAMVVDKEDLLAVAVASYRKKCEGEIAAVKHDIKRTTQSGKAAKARFEELVKELDVRADLTGGSRDLLIALLPADSGDTCTVQAVNGWYLSKVLVDGAEKLTIDSNPGVRIRRIPANKDKQAIDLAWISTEGKAPVPREMSDAIDEVNAANKRLVELNRDLMEARSKMSDGEVRKIRDIARTQLARMSLGNSDEGRALLERMDAGQLLLS